MAERPFFKWRTRLIQLKSSNSISSAQEARSPAGQSDARSNASDGVVICTRRLAGRSSSPTCRRCRSDSGPACARCCSDGEAVVVHGKNRVNVAMRVDGGDGTGVRPRPLKGRIDRRSFRCFPRFASICRRFGVAPKTFRPRLHFLDGDVPAERSWPSKELTSAAQQLLCCAAVARQRQRAAAAAERSWSTGFTATSST